MVAASAVAGELVVDIAHRADQKLLGKKLRHAPVEVKVGAVLVVGIRIDEVIREAGHRRKLVSGLRIEIRVAGAGIQRVMPDSDVRKTGSIIKTDGQVPR